MIKSPLNKAVSAANKTNIPQYKDKDLQKVADAVFLIGEKSKEVRASFQDNLNRAQDGKKAAQDARAKAETESDLDKAVDSEHIHSEREKFWKDKLDKFPFIPQISEKEYNGYVSAVDTVVIKSAESYRKKAEKAMNELIAARQEFDDTVSDADRILKDLDNNSRFLQSKYRVKVQRCTIVADPRVKDRYLSRFIWEEDPSAWQQHAKRYRDNGAAVWLGTRDSKNLEAAWRAVSRVQYDPWANPNPF